MRLIMKVLRCYLLSKRQQLILMLKEQGFTNQRIAEQVVTSRSTVQRELRKIRTRDASGDFDMENLVRALVRKQCYELNRVETAEDRLAMRDKIIGRLLPRRYVKRSPYWWRKKRR